MLSQNGLYGLTLLAGHKPFKEYAHATDTFVIGTKANRYHVGLKNSSPRRVMVILTIDGLCAIEGLEQATNGLGYIMEPHQQLVIDGWRFLINVSASAPFQFGVIPESYHEVMDTPSNWGTITATFFAEQRVPRYRANYIAQSGVGFKKYQGLVWANEVRGRDERWLQQQFAKENSALAELTLQYEELEVLGRMGIINLPPASE